MRVHHGNGQTFKKIILANGLEGEGGNIINVNGTHHRVQPPIPLPLLYRTVHSWGSLRPVNAIVASFLDFKKGGKNINGRKNSNSESFFSRWLIFFFFSTVSRKKKNESWWLDWVRLCIINPGAAATAAVRALRPRVPEYEVERSLHSIRERFIARFILAGDLFRGSRN